MALTPEQQKKKDEMVARFRTDAPLPDGVTLVQIGPGLRPRPPAVAEAADEAEEAAEAQEG